MKRTAIAAAAALLAVGLASCGGGSGDSTIRGAAAPSGDPAPADPAPNAPSSDQAMDAEAVVRALSAKIPSAKVSVVYDETTESNHLLGGLGRPGQYTSKVAFVDHRLDKSEVSSEKGDIEQGGGVEVFGSDADAQKREEYIKAITSSASMFAEYTYRSGSRVLRLSHYLTPTQAKPYQDAFEAMG